MSIASELQNYADGLDDAYDAVNDMSGIIPQHKNMNNLDQAIRTIPQNPGTTYTAGNGIDIDANNEISIDNTVVPEFSDLATVATTGNYSDLSGAPTIPTNTSDLTNDGDDGVHPFLATDDVATVATSGLYSDLTGTPTIPTKTSDLVNDGADNTSTYVEADELATVATSGAYSDLSGTPTIPTNTSDLVNDGSDGTSTYVEADELAAVATSGDYTDLINTPSDRLYRMLVPTGTEITSNKNLNTVAFLVVGRYYCSANATVATLTNCPTSNAFMMEVFSPLSTTIDDETTRAWCYRTRILTTFTGEMYVQTCSTNATPNNWSYGSWRRYDVPGIKNATTQTHTDYNNNQDYLPNMRFLSFWNGAHNSSNNSNLKYFASSSVTTANLQDGCVTSAKLNDFNTANTTDTWVPVSASGGKIQHRVIKAFNSDGTIPTGAIANSAVTNDKISNNTIAMGKINWSTMRAAFTGTTDGNGFIAVPTGTVKPTTGFILGARRVKNNDTGQTDGILLPYTDHSQSRYTLKFVNWNLQANGNQNIKVEIIYCLLS